MFKLSLREEDILMRIKVTKPIKNKDIVKNFVGNLLTPAGGDIANNICIILTKDSIYIEAKGHVSIGYAEETRRVDQILLKDIKEFVVVPKGNEEIINITTEKKEFTFIRDNKKNDNLAFALANAINDMK